MLLNTRRSPTRVDICDFNRLHLRDHNANINTRNYLSSKSPSSPMPYRDFRLVVTNRIPSNIVILSRTSSLSATPTNSSKLKRRKSEHNKSSKQPGFDVYRSLARSVSRCSISSERDLSNDDMNHLANPFTIDRISLSPSTGYFHPNNLSKTPKYYIYSNEKRRLFSRAKTYDELSSSSRFEYMQRISPETFHRTTPTNPYYEEEDDDETLTTATTITPNILPCTPTTRTRKQIHVYVPHVSC
ncbi:unnamed protein product [Rotaria sordida]|uniref:Uncharacterized protein n=1 Tax=Rotaria sordida TaxID=392033 RepID=A0A815LTS9_9BILA|nr:unnamed protein product [Rotaria sordida]CAF1414670.1 unnamed protein product [Rotaria sordida]